MERVGKVWFVLWALAIASAGAQRPASPVGTMQLSSMVIHVRDLSGTPLPVVATVKISGPAADGEITVFTREGGRATVGNLRPGQYQVDVTAAGYQTGHEEMSIYGFDAGHCFVTMRPEGPAGSDQKAEPEVPLLVGKSRKELDLAIAALREGKAAEAARHLDFVLKHAPGNPDVQYIAATYSLRTGDLAAARQHLEAAVRIFPGHFSAQLALGELLIQQNDAAGALPHLEKCVALDPNSWRGHWLFAEACLRARSDSTAAQAHANRAIELGKDKATAAVVTLAVAEAVGGATSAARDRLEEFLRDHPQDPDAPRVRQILASPELAAPAAKPAAFVVPVAGPRKLDVGGDIPLGSLPPEFLARLPRGIDAAVPIVDPGTSCSLPEVLQGASHGAQEFATALERFTAKESILHEELDPAGGIRHSDQRSFDYTAGLHRSGDDLGVSEMRNGSLSTTFSSDFAVMFASKGVPAVAMVFYPTYLQDFQFTCEGLGQSHGRPAWQVRFQQRGDRPARIHSWIVNDQFYPVSLKGRAWLSAGTFHILRVETDLVRPIDGIRLDLQHMAIDYAPVDSSDRKYQLWLPASAEITSRFRGRTFRQRHDFSDFVLFKVDASEKIKSK